MEPILIFCDISFCEGCSHYVAITAFQSLYQVTVSTLHCQLPTLYTTLHSLLPIFYSLLSLFLYTFYSPLSTLHSPLSSHYFLHSLLSTPHSPYSLLYTPFFYSPLSSLLFLPSTLYFLFSTVEMVSSVVQRDTRTNTYTHVNTFLASTQHRSSPPAIAAPCHHRQQTSMPL